MPHHAAQRRAYALRQLARRGLAILGSEQPDLHQLMVQERPVHGADHRVGEPRAAHLHHRAQRVGARPQEASLRAVEVGGRHGATRLAAALLAALVLAACAETMGPPTPWSRTPAETPGEPIPPLSPDAESLLLARSVLDQRAPQLDPLAREGVATLLARAEIESRLPALLVLALIEQESRFDPRARGPSGSLGLMQVQPSLGRALAGRVGVAWQGPATLFDPIANVRIGVGYLQDQVRAFGNHELALAAYNMGPTRLRRRLAAGESGRSAYVGGVLGRYHSLRVQYGETRVGLGR